MSARHLSEPVLGIDVGGSSVKAGLVDMGGARLIGELISAQTPTPATPASLLAVMRDLVQQLPGARRKLGVAFPSVISAGTVRTAANIDRSWLGTQPAALLEQLLQRPAVVLNDADAAGIAEMTWGAGRGLRGSTIMLTFGTGIGTALFVEGKLFPNTELGHLEIDGVDAEKWASAHARAQLNLDFPAWAARVNVYLARMNALFWPDLFILGGAISERFGEFAELLHSPAPVRAAHFAGQSGVIGAALAAAA